MIDVRVVGLDFILEQTKDVSLPHSVVHGLLDSYERVYGRELSFLKQNGSYHKRDEPLYVFLASKATQKQFVLVLDVLKDIERRKGEGVLVG